MNNPVKNVIDLSGFSLFSKKPSFTTDSRLVVAAKNGTSFVVDSEKQLSKGELMSGKYSKIYEINTLPITLMHHKEYECSDMVNRFEVEISAKCQVTDPVAIVKSNVEDMKDTADKAISATLTQVLSLHSIEDYSLLNRDSNLFENKINLTLEDEGLQLSKLSVTIRPYADYKKVKKEIIEGERRRELSKHNTDIQQDLDRDRYNIDSNRQLLESELARQKQRIDAEDNAQKMNLIMSYIKEGNENALSFLLKDDLDSLNMYQELNERRHNRNKEDLESLLRLSKEYDIDISELIIYQKAPEGVATSFAASQSMAKSISVNKDGYSPQQLTTDDEE